MTANNQTVTKNELSEALFDQVGLNKREAKDMVESFFEEIRLALENGDSVKLSVVTVICRLWPRALRALNLKQLRYDPARSDSTPLALFETATAPAVARLAVK